jgi:hypothetical protein
MGKDGLSALTFRCTRAVPEKIVRFLLFPRGTWLVTCPSQNPAHIAVAAREFRPPTKTNDSHSELNASNNALSGPRPRTRTPLTFCAHAFRFRRKPVPGSGICLRLLGQFFEDADGLFRLHQCGVSVSCEGLIREF